MLTTDKQLLIDNPSYMDYPHHKKILSPWIYDFKNLNSPPCKWKGVHTVFMYINLKQLSHAIFHILVWYSHLVLK